MLKDSLYQIKSAEHLNNEIKATLEINQHHDILKGHFPGQPVLPGACMLQMMKEVLENTRGNSLELKKADNIKFIQLIDPQKNNIILLKLLYRPIEDNGIYVTANMFAEETVCFKFQGTFY